LKKTMTQIQALRRARTAKATEAARAAGKLFQPGQSGNPGGKPVAARNRLQGDFLRTLAEDFAKYGRAAMARAREEDPLGYLRVIASVMPKELELRRPLEDMPEEEILALMERMKAAARSLGIRLEEPEEGGEDAGAAEGDERRPKLQ